METQGNDAIITELLRIVQDIDTKLTSYREESKEQFKRLTDIENKIEDIRKNNKPRKTWFQKLFEKK